MFSTEELAHRGELSPEFALQLLFCEQAGCELPAWVPGAAQSPRGISSRPMLATSGDLAFLTAPELERGVFSHLGFFGTIPLLCDFQRLQRDSSITSARSSRSQAVQVIPGPGVLHSFRATQAPSLSLYTSSASVPFQSSVFCFPGFGDSASRCQGQK